MTPTKPTSTSSFSAVRNAPCNQPIQSSLRFKHIFIINSFLAIAGPMVKCSKSGELGISALSSVASTSTVAMSFPSFFALSFTVQFSPLLRSAARHWCSSQLKEAFVNNAPQVFSMLWHAFLCSSFRSPSSASPGTVCNVGSWILFLHKIRMTRVIRCIFQNCYNFGMCRALCKSRVLTPPYFSGTCPSWAHSKAGDRCWC